VNDDRIGRYLSDQAEGIALIPADPDNVMRRGSRRRTRRRTAFVGSLAVVAVLTTSVALRDGADDQKVDNGYAAPDVSASTFDWSIVNPQSGLAYASSSVQLGGSIYSLSTAPAVPGDPDPYDDAGPPTLYRSDDGAEWSQVGSPDGVRASAIAGSGDTLYALGTAPAGGGTRDLVMATSNDGAASWSNVTLPRDVAELEARHPGKITIGQPRIAALDATHLLASISVSANLDPAAYAPELAERDGAYVSEWTGDGLVVRDAGEPCDYTGATSESTTAPSPEEQEQIEADAAAGARRACVELSSKDEPGEVIASYTWDQMGIDEELRGLIEGRSITYVSDDGATFERVDVPEEAGQWTTALLATPDGYRILQGSYGPDVAPTATVLSSPDGRTWTVDTQLPGSPGTAGILNDRLAVSVFDDRGAATVQIQQSDGSWTPVDLSQAVTVPDGYEAWVGEVAFGPLGMAAVVTTSSSDPNGGAMGDAFLIHSTDLTSLSVLPLADHVDEPCCPSGVVVTADAIAVRFTETPDDDQSTPPSQVVLVGTPTG
jgi:hypothetical protein